MAPNTKIKLNLDSLKSRREWKRHKVKDGHNIFRILPPFGEASNGYPYHKWQVIWGLFDPESGRPRPFASSITTEKKCPITEYVETLKKRSETLKAQMQSSGESEDFIKERLSGLSKLLSDLSPKTVYIYNAVDKAGEVGLLELKSTAHKKMKTEMNNYIHDYNQDPTSLLSNEDDSGAWFDVLRQGLGRDTEYDVKRVSIKSKNPTTGKISFEDDRSPLPDSVVENYDNLAYDLTSVYQIKSYDELSEILESNMAAIIEVCPDADLSVDVSFEQPVVKKATTTAAVNTTKQSSFAANSSSKVASKPAVKLNLKDEDDEEEEEETPRSRSSNKATMSAKSNSVDDDDFLAEADALLNS